MRNDIGSRLKELRIQNRYTQKEIADFLGVTPKAISFYELGQREAPYSLLVKIADKYNVSVDYLLTGDTDGYYIDPKTAKLAQEAFDDPDVRILLDAKRDLSPEDLQLVIDMVKRLKGLEK